jgi:hypothetical protein
LRDRRVIPPSEGVGWFPDMRISPARPALPLDLLARDMVHLPDLILLTMTIGSLVQ